MDLTDSLRHRHHRRRRRKNAFFRRAARFFRSSFKGLLLSFAIGFLGIVGFVALGTGLVVWHYTSGLPGYDAVVKRDVVESSKIYSRDGTLLYEFHGEVKRTRVDLSQISPFLKDATVAVEDKDFYTHGPISLTGIARAILVNYKSGGVSQGGSTITQQYVKNALLNSDRSFGRKISEIFLAYKIESHLNKDQILNLYLNEIPYGRNAYGAEAASQTYFGKSAKDLTLAESAYLAALPQAPSFFSPTGPNAELLETRKNTILEIMKQQGYISQEQYDEGRNDQVAFKDVRTTIIAPHFVAYVQNYLTQKYGKEFLREGGLKVYTTLDLHLQALAEKVVAEGVAKNVKENNAHNAALVAIEPSSGKILAMVGGKDYFGSPEPKGCNPGTTGKDSCTFEPHVNAASSQRQPGSSFKPFVYVTAFDKEFGYSPMSPIVDGPISFPTLGGRNYTPRNYDGSYHGLVTMRKALAGSLNVPAVKTLSLVGVNKAVETAHGLGITSPLKDCGLSLVLGGCEVRLVDHVASYASLANGGKANYATPFVRIEDKNGIVLEDYHVQNRQVVDPAAAYELISIMTDNDARTYIFGKNSPLTLPGRTVAAKTGTTNSWKDGWTIGFTPQLAAGVWTGNDNGTLMRQGADGVFTAAPIWHSFMEQALAGELALEFPVPSDIVQVRYSQSTNKPAGKNDKKTRLESFAYYALPKELKQLAVPAGAQVKIKPQAAPVPKTTTTQGVQVSAGLEPENRKKEN
jgi:1A family penicillin-binding protein